MLMDMFYRATEGVVKHRRRFHFHEVKREKDKEEKLLDTAVRSLK